jgi:hypothetical protein
LATFPANGAMVALAPTDFGRTSLNDPGPVIIMDIGKQTICVEAVTKALLFPIHSVESGKRIRQGPRSENGCGDKMQKPTEILLLEDQHQVSRRFAVFEDDGTSAWLYLTEPGYRKPALDVWVYNRIEAPPTSAIEAYRGGPPPAAQGYVSNSALCQSPEAHQWTFTWSSDGESVAALKDDKPVACVVAGSKFGYSRELIADGPWGRPWSDDVFRSTFG